MLILGLDTETTGTDLRHGARPFLVTFCDGNGENIYFEWEVDPLTRQPIMVNRDLIEIQTLISDADRLILQNAKFDVTALSVATFGKLKIDWNKIHDTLIAGHLLASNQPHDLTSMVLKYLSVDVEPYEDKLKQACNKARSIARSEYPDWRIAKAGLPEMPSAKSTVWKYDAWLPRTIALQGDPKKRLRTVDDSWLTVTSEYANVDSAVLVPLFNYQRELLEKRGLWDIYLTRLKAIKIAYDMEERGITLSGERLEKLCEEYSKEAARSARICCNIAHSFGCDLILPKSGNNKSLLEFCFGKEGIIERLAGVLSVGWDKSKSIDLPVIKTSVKTGKPSLDKSVLESYEATLPERSRQLLFVKSLKAKRKRDTAINYMESYKRFWLPLHVDGCVGEGYEIPDWYILHPSLNITGTDTLRWSSSNPNEQNISKQEGFNIRYCFGPAPGREWWSLDAANIELRIPAYESGERDFIDLFERPNDPPYFGSNHLLVSHILHPKLFEECKDGNGELDGRIFKKKYASTWYQWIKNGNFAVTYGAVEESGTADRAYHVPGAQRRLKSKFGQLAKLNSHWIAFAEKHGYVETLPDKAVNPNRGYPLLCTRTEYGRILPTVPLNYHVQGTAMWWMLKAMIRCSEYLDRLNTTGGRSDYYMIIQVHDELVFDFPKGKGKDPWKTNLPKIRKIQQLMAQGGNDIGVPTPIGVEYHAETWSEGISA